MITDQELAAFKEHLVAEGEVKHPSVLVNHVKRGWQDILEAGEPELFPDGEFDRVLRAALEDFVRHRATPLVETVNEIRARAGLPQSEDALLVNRSGGFRLHVGVGYRDVAGIMWRVRRIREELVHGHQIFEAVRGDTCYSFLINGVCRETRTCDLVAEVHEGT